MTRDGELIYGCVHVQGVRGLRDRVSGKSARASNSKILQSSSSPPGPIFNAASFFARVERNEGLPRELLSLFSYLKGIRMPSSSHRLQARWRGLAYVFLFERGLTSCRSLNVNLQHEGLSDSLRCIICFPGLQHISLLHPDPKSLANRPPPLPVPNGSPFFISSSIQAPILILSLIIFVSTSLSVSLSILLPPNPASVGKLVIPYSMPRSIIFPLF